MTRRHIEIILIISLIIIVIKNTIDNFIQPIVKSIGHDPIPPWFDLKLLPLLREKWLEKKKFNVNRFMTVVRFLTPAMTGSPLWKDLEQKIDEIKINTRPDVIIGIKSGGAFMANRLALRWSPKPDVQYMRIKKYGTKSPIERIQLWYRYLTSSVNDAYQCDMDAAVVTEYPPREAVTDKHILVLDDQVGSGSTLKKAKRVLLSMGAKSIRTCVISVVYPKGRKHVSYGGTYPFILAWPWGCDS